LTITIGIRSCRSSVPVRYVTRSGKQTAQSDAIATRRSRRPRRRSLQWRCSPRRTRLPGNILKYRNHLHSRPQLFLCRRAAAALPTSSSSRRHPKLCRHLCQSICRLLPGSPNPPRQSENGCTKPREKDSLPKQ